MKKLFLLLLFSNLANAHTNMTEYSYLNEQPYIEESESLETEVCETIECADSEIKITEDEENTEDIKLYIIKVS